MPSRCRFPALRFRAPLLVVAAHPDDETAGAGGLIARSTARGRSVFILFLTDGAPRDQQYFARGFQGDQSAYRAQRRREALAATAALGVPASRVVFCPIPDLELYAHRMQAAGYLRAQLAATDAQTLLVPAAESGHPDHDTAHGLVLSEYWAAAHCTLAAWEYPLYAWHRGRIRYGWLPPSRSVVVLPLDRQQQAAKARALSAYTSQRETLAPFPRTGEAFRPVRRRPPRRQAVWRAWGWRLPAGASGSAAARPCAS